MLPDGEPDDSKRWSPDPLNTGLTTRQAAICAIAAIRNRYGLRKPAELVLPSPIESIIDYRGERKPTAAERAEDHEKPTHIDARAVTARGHVVTLDLEQSSNGSTIVDVWSDIPAAQRDLLLQLISNAISARK
jgi:hypothetical protein